MGRYISRGLPWSNGLGKRVTDCITSNEVIEKAKLNWGVNKCPLVAKIPFSINGQNNIDENTDAFTYKGNIYHECDSAFATYRTDINVPLGIVKSKYEVVQNNEAFKFFDDAIGKDKAVWQYAGMYGLGHKVFVTAKLPNTIEVGKDIIDNYLVFSNSHDGSSSINILFSPIRVICTNALNSALQSASSFIRIRHTESAKEKLETGAQILRIAAEHAQTAKQIYDSLLTINMSDDEVKEFILKLNLTPREFELLSEYDNLKTAINKLYSRDYMTTEFIQVSTRKLNTIVNMYEYYQEGIGQEDIIGTAWGAYNSITGYFSNIANLQGEKRMDSLLYGNASKVSLTALNDLVKAV